MSVAAHMSEIISGTTLTSLPLFIQTSVKGSMDVQTSRIKIRLGFSQTLGKIVSLLWCINSATELLGSALLKSEILILSPL